MSDTQAVTPYNEPQALDLAVQRFELEQRMAKLFISSGLFSDIKGTSVEQAIAQAYVKIAMGNSMGFSPAESMQGIDVIQGKPVVGAQLRAARMQRAGYSWKIERLDDKGCTLTVFFKGDNLGQADFIDTDAQRLGLLGKDNWKKDPQSMYFARAITRAQRRYAPGVLSLDVESREEVTDLEVLDAISVPSEAATQAAVATHNKTEALGKRISEKKQEALPAPAASDTGLDNLSNGHPFGKPYAELYGWQKNILAAAGNLSTERAMATLATIGIMSMQDITQERAPEVLTALREAAREQPVKDLF